MKQKMSFDHVLLIGYGGPRAPAEVLPFLQKMAEGKNVPDACLKAVAGHYQAIGGSSPYHDVVMHFARSLEEHLRANGIPMPVFAGMKNWHPFLRDVLGDIGRRGHKQGLAIVLNAFKGAVSGAGYQEGLKAAQAALKGSGVEYDFIDGYSDKRPFLDAQAQNVSRVLEGISAGERSAVPILFSFHSLPVQTAQGKECQPFLDEARDASAAVAKALGHKNWSVVYQNKPMHARSPWLGPDVTEEIEKLAQQGQKRVVVVPLGFFCDHVEILYDLDCKTRDLCGQLGVEYSRAPTVIDHPNILNLFRELISS